MRSIRSSVLSLTALFLSASAFAQDPSIRIGKEGFVLPQGELPLDHVIEKAAEYLAWNILSNHGPHRALQQHRQRTQ